MSKILNNLICTAMLFALSFLWVYYCLKSVVWAVTLAAVIALCAAYIMWRMQCRLGNIRTAKSQSKKNVLKLADYLKYNDDNSAVFAPLYGYYGYEVSVIDYDSFVVVKNNVKTLVCLRFEEDSLKQTALQQAIVTAKRSKLNKLAIYCAKADAAARKAASAHFDVTIIDVGNVYRLLSECDKLPTLPDAKPTKNSFAASYAFNRKRFGWYFGSSIFMTLVSIVAYFPYYTLGWATVMLALALYSLFNTRYNAIQTTIRLD